VEFDRDQNKNNGERKCRLNRSAMNWSSCTWSCQSNLVTWTSGNVSIRDKESGYVVIKPSGIMYEDLKAEDMVVLDLDGKVIEGGYKPSSDTASHLYIYRHRPDVFGVVHTHSPYATAFAAIGKPIPVYLTAQADEFGGPIPCGAVCPDRRRRDRQSGGREHRQIARHHAEKPRRLHHWPIRQSGVKAAIMVEDVARTIWLAPARRAR
jgi:L-ribulose-5-phosphate 4-epimerase